MRGEMLSSGRMIPWSRAAAGIFSVAVVLVSPIHAATIDVTTFEDVVADDGACALREAIGAVNAQAASGALVGECVAGDGNDDTIVLAAGSYYLTIIGAGETGNASGDLDLRANMTIAGNAGAPTTIDASRLSAARSATIRARLRSLASPTSPTAAISAPWNWTMTSSGTGSTEACAVADGSVLVKKSTSCRFFQSRVRYTPGRAPANQALECLTGEQTLLGLPSRLFNSKPLRPSSRTPTSASSRRCRRSCSRCRDRRRRGGCSSRVCRP